MVVISLSEDLDIHFTGIESFPHFVCGANLSSEKNWSFFKENVTCSRCLEILNMSD